jgi:hypothetical protein
MHVLGSDERHPRAGEIAPVLRDIGMNTDHAFACRKLPTQGALEMNAEYVPGSTGSCRKTRFTGKTR